MQADSLSATGKVARQTVDVVGAAQMLGVSERMLAQLTKAGQVPHKRVAGRILYPIDALRRFVNDPEPAKTRPDRS